MATVFFLTLLTACAGSRANEAKEDFVEIPNPGVTSSVNAPETIWVPRSYVETGVPRGQQLVKEGYKAMRGKPEPPPPHPGAAEQRAVEPRAPEPRAPEPVNAGIVEPGGKQANLIPRFGLVMAVDQERIYFNIGKEAGLAPGQKLKVYRGGTVVEGLGLAPGQYVATIELVGFVGTNGGYGIRKEGAPVQKNDLIGVE